MTAALWRRAQRMAVCVQLLNTTSSLFNGNADQCHVLRPSVQTDIIHQANKHINPYSVCYGKYWSPLLIREVSYLCVNKCYFIGQENNRQDQGYMWKYFLHTLSRTCTIRNKRNISQAFHKRHQIPWLGGNHKKTNSYKWLVWIRYKSN